MPKFPCWRSQKLSKEEKIMSLANYLEEEQSEKQLPRGFKSHKEVLKFVSKQKNAVSLSSTIGDISVRLDVRFEPSDRVVYEGILMTFNGYESDGCASVFKRKSRRQEKKEKLKAVRWSEGNPTIGRVNANQLISFKTAVFTTIMENVKNSIPHRFETVKEKEVHEPCAQKDLGLEPHIGQINVKKHIQNTEKPMEKEMDQSFKIFPHSPSRQNATYEANELGPKLETGATEKSSKANLRHKHTNGVSCNENYKIKTKKVNYRVSYLPKRQIQLTSPQVSSESVPPSTQSLEIVTISINADHQTPDESTTNDRQPNKEKDSDFAIAKINSLLQDDTIIKTNRVNSITDSGIVIEKNERHDLLSFISSIDDYSTSKKRSLETCSDEENYNPPKIKVTEKNLISKINTQVHAKNEILGNYTVEWDRVSNGRLIQLSETNLNQLALPPNKDAIKFGTGKGIQWQRNSCYVDACIFALFFASTALDRLTLFSGENEPTSDVFSALYSIVNSLRRDQYCPANKIQKLRKVLQKRSNSSAIVSSMMDVEEFLQILFRKGLNLKEFFQYHEGQSDFLHTIYIYAEKYANLETLFKDSMEDWGELKFASCPDPLLLVHVSRPDDKPRLVIPNLEMNITDLLQRENEHQGNCTYSLQAVICLKSMHYTAFVKVDHCQDTWVYFDSMGPCVQKCNWNYRYDNKHCETNDLGEFLESVKQIKEIKTSSQSYGLQGLGSFLINYGYLFVYSKNSF